MGDGSGSIPAGIMSGRVGRQHRYVYAKGGFALLVATEVPFVPGSSQPGAKVRK